MGNVVSGPGEGLAREAIGLREVLFQSITHMAPAAAVVFSIPFGITFGGGATPLAVIIAIVACLLVAISIGQLAKHLPSAGSFYTYTSRGLNPSVGFMVAWLYAFVEPLVAPLLFLNLGFAAADFFHTEVHWAADLWWPWALVGAAIVFFLGYRGIRVSAGTGTVLGIFEIGVFVALAIWLIAQAHHNTLAVFTTKYANNPGFKGFSGIFAASVFTVLAFIGFEAAAPLSEEAKNPRRSIGIAVVASCLLIGLYYVLTTYAATVFFGPTRMTKFQVGTSWPAMAQAVWGSAWVLVFAAIVNSTIANSNAGSNAATRTWFAMGRQGLLPRALAAVHPRYRSPHVAVWLQLDHRVRHRGDGHRDPVRADLHAGEPVVSRVLRPASAERVQLVPARRRPRRRHRCLRSGVLRGRGVQGVQLHLAADAAALVCGDRVGRVGGPGADDAKPG